METKWRAWCNLKHPILSYDEDSRMLAGSTLVLSSYGGGGRKERGRKGGREKEKESSYVGSLNLLELAAHE